MTHFDRMRYIFSLTLFGSLAASALSVWPEALGYGCVAVCLALPGGLVAMGILAWFLYPRVTADRWQGTRPWSAATVVLLIATPVLLCTGLPWRAAFHLSRPELEAAARQVPEPWEHLPGGWIGVLYIDEYAADPRGGVFFRTWSHPDGIGPDTMSYGFAYKPNPTRTPFGQARYRLTPLTDDWFTFEVSDD